MNRVSNELRDESFVAGVLLDIAGTPTVSDENFPEKFKSENFPI
jgi:hypothetical protein